jgi:hypothetical protein
MEIPFARSRAVSRVAVVVMLCADGGLGCVATEVCLLRVARM